MPDPNAPPGSPDASYGHGFDSFSQRDMEIAGAAGAFGGRAQLYGAIAYSPSTGRHGWSSRAGDQATAEKTAMDYCGAPDARIAVWGYNTHLALAVADGGVYAGVWDGNAKTAATRAKQACGRPDSRVVIEFDTRQSATAAGERRNWLLPFWLGHPRRWVPVALVAFAIGAFGSAGVFGGANSDDATGEIVLGVICLVVAAVVFVVWRPKKGPGRT